MSLAEIRGTPLGTKMGVKPVTATVVKVPTVLKAKVNTAPVKTGVLPQLTPAFQFVQGLGSFVEAIAPINKETTVAPTGVYRSVTPQYGPGVKEAVLEAAQRKMGLSIVQTPRAQQIISLARSAAIVKNISAQGYELAPKGTKDYLGIAQTQAAQFAEELNAFRGLQEEWSTKQSGYLKTLSDQEKLLAGAANEGAIAKGQLDLLKTDYDTLMKQYQDLLNQPQSPGINIEMPNLDIFGGLKDWINKYGLIVAGGAIGLIILLVVLNRRK